MSFDNARKGQPSPWGRVEYSKTLAPGIDFVGTSSHGGIVLSDERRQAMPDDFRTWSSRFSKPPFYEEDCDWAVPTLAFASEMSPDDVRAAASTVIGMPLYFAPAIVRAAHGILDRAATSEG